MSTDAIRSCVITAIQGKAKEFAPLADHNCREAVNRRHCDDATERMQDAAYSLAKLSGATEVADFAITQINARWPLQTIKLADELARSARAYIECECENNREELKVSYYRYLQDRGGNIDDG